MKNGSPLLLGVLLATGAHAAAPPDSFDVLVYGGTASGIMAAVAASRDGMHVALLEASPHLGGMLSGGLSNADVDNQQQLIGGLARSFFEAAGSHYGKPVAWAFEPHVASQILTAMLEKAHVTTCLECPLSAVRKKGTAIESIATTNGRTLDARIFIDSSYEGDLMKSAGVSYVVGREGRTQYGESLAGRQDILPGHHQFKFAVAADNGNGGLLPWITPENQAANIGDADGKFQSYCYRLCLTDDPSNRVTIERPQGYDPHTYELARRYLESAKGALSLNDFLGIIRIPNGKTDINSTGPVSTDLLGASWEYPEANYGRRKQIAEEHLRWAQGLIYFLQNDAAVPSSIKTAVQKLGLPKDEFTANGHWPPQLYVREGRRMQGEYFLTQHDLQEFREKYDSIGMAGYNIDIREVQWLAHKVYMFPNVINQVFMEGYLSMPVEPWELPYRALLPKQQQASNLLVSVCISASTIAYASFRMEANYMIAGESAGTAAALALKTNRTVHQLDIVLLEQALRRNHQILTPDDVVSHDRIARRAN